MRLLIACLIATPALARPVHQFIDVRLSPDGRTVASIEGDEPEQGGAPVLRDLVLRRITGETIATVVLPCGRVPQCTPASPVFAPDGHLAFALRQPGGHRRAVYTVDADGTNLKRGLDFDGTVDDLKFGPRGELAVLATEGAMKETGAVEAGAARAGVLGEAPREQRLALIENGGLHWVSPADLFVYQYDWRPDGSGFVATAAPGDGDNNWWIAKLYSFPRAGEPAVLYEPDLKDQIADPIVSADGDAVSLIVGLMSDFGSTGGRLIVRSAWTNPSAHQEGGEHGTVVSLGSRCDDRLIVSELVRGQQEIRLKPERHISFGLNPGVFGVSDGGVASNPEPPDPLWTGPEHVAAGSSSTHNAAVAQSCASPVTVTVRQDFTHPPEIVAGPIGQWQPITHANDGLTVPAKARSITWSTDAGTAQGWVLTPDPPPPGPRPLITIVHGGPAAAVTPQFIDGLPRALLDAGYALFLPNPRGSFGAGEAFTRANIRDLGHGDLADILAGIDAVAKTTPVDQDRLGIMGGSYGGFMTMWAVTQTDRFKAAVALAGISDWTSYYGQNGIDRWMIPYFGASVYDDPQIYRRSSPIEFIRNVHTPTLEAVGADDIECPAPQTLEFWHALAALGVPTQGIVYAGEGHHFRDPGNIADLRHRIVTWFGTYLR